MVDVSQFFDKKYEQQEFDDLAEAPVDAIQGLSQSDADSLKQALGIDTVRDLAENKFVRIAQAVMAMSSVAALQGAHGGEVTFSGQWTPQADPDKRRTEATEQEPDFKDFLLAAPDFEILEIHRSDEPARSVELQ